MLKFHWVELSANILTFSKPNRCF